MGKEPAWNAGDAEDVGLIPVSGRSPGGGHGNPLQYSCLEHPMDRWAWRAMVTKSQTQLEQLSTNKGQDRIALVCDAQPTVCMTQISNKWHSTLYACVYTDITHIYDVVTTCDIIYVVRYIQFSSVAQSWLTPWTPGLSVHHQLPEFTQTHIHWVGDAIQPSHPLSSPSPPAPNPSQHQGIFQWVSSSHQVAKVLGFQL